MPTTPTRPSSGSVTGPGRSWQPGPRSRPAPSSGWSSSRAAEPGSPPRSPGRPSGGGPVRRSAGEDVESMTRTSRRGSEAWGRRASPAEPAIEVLIPTFRRPTELAVTLAGLAAQDDPSFAVIISDQSEGDPPWHQPAVAAMVRVLEAQGRPVTVHQHRPRRGLAEHRQFLLDQATTEAVLFLDDDVWLEPGTLHRLSEALEVL